MDLGISAGISLYVVYLEGRRIILGFYFKGFDLRVRFEG